MSVAFSPDSKEVVSGSYDGTIKTWNIVLGVVNKSFTAHNGAVFAVTYSNDGNYIISGGQDYSVKWWNFKKNRQAAEFIAKAPVISLSIAKQTNLLAVVDSLSNVYLLSKF